MEFGNCACFNLRKATRAVTQHYDRIMKPSGLRGTQFTILAVLSKTGEISISHLADFLIMDRTTVTRNLRPLEKLNLLKVVSGEDLRVRKVHITEKGLSRLEEASPLWEKAQSEIRSNLGEEKLSNLLSTLSETIAVTK